MKFGSRAPAYTGEDGIEVFFAAEDAPRVWNEILEKGKPLGIRPCGLGARDTLRLRCVIPERLRSSPEHNPLEAGSGFSSTNEPNFTGRKIALWKKTPASRAASSLQDEGQKPATPRRTTEFSAMAEAGELPAATLSPSLNYGIGMTYLTTPAPKPGEEIEIEIRGQKFPAVIEKKPLYKKP